VQLGGVIEEQQEIDAIVTATLPATTPELQTALADAGHRASKSVVQLSLQRLRASGVVIERQDGAYHSAATLDEYTISKHEGRRVRDLRTRAESTAGMYPTPGRVEACRLLSLEAATLELELKHKMRAHVLARRIERDQKELASLQVSMTG
jgi:hypothetical protein